jgi:hypothetical protein
VDALVYQHGLIQAKAGAGTSVCYLYFIAPEEITSGAAPPWFHLAMQQSLEPINERLDTMNERINTVTQRLDTVTQRLDNVTERLNRLTAVTTRTARLSAIVCTMIFLCYS